jgi:S1-C subfamily serine protease
MYSLTLILSFLLVTLNVRANPQEVAKSLFASTVLISTDDANGHPLAIGSGFVVGEGLIATNFHVIESASGGYVKLVGSKQKVEITGIVCFDSVSDLAIVQADGIKAPSVKFSEREKPAVGEAVFAAGNPRGLEGTFSAGIISAVREFGDAGILQITAPISPGSSGGPIADETGAVVGIAVATYKGGQNLNFAIPIKELSNLLARNGKPASLRTVSKAKGKDVFANLESGKITEGVTVTNFTWKGTSAAGTSLGSGEFSVSLQNNLREPVRSVHALIIFHNPEGQVIDCGIIKSGEIIPAKLARRTTGEVDPSVVQLTTPKSKANQFMFALRPTTKIVFRVLGFEIVEE